MSQDFFQIARSSMIDGQLKPNGIINAELLDQFDKLPREVFVDDVSQAFAYADSHLYFSDGRFLLSPVSTAQIISYADIQLKDNLLNIGATSGYSSILMSPLAQTVFSLDNDSHYSYMAEQNCTKMGVYNVVVFDGPLEKANTKYQPYSKILLQGASAQIPNHLLSQLEDDGKIVFIYRPNGKKYGNIAVYSKIGPSKGKMVLHEEVAAPYLPGYAQQKQFVF